MRYFIFLVILGIDMISLSQANSINFSEENKVYALSIGISNYANVRSLKYAHNDALAFSDYLNKNKFWGEKKIVVTTLINEQAKSGSVISEMNKIIDNSIKGDQVIFYFAGHGDVETLNNAGVAYLLTYDSPQNTYDIGGKISSLMIDDFFDKLSSKGVFVYLIIDACRSGGLAGGINGVSQTNLAFLQKKGSEVRILSSQYNQTSIEKASLDDGRGTERGVFSYYLEKGLIGFANYDANNFIDLAELNLYLTKNVKYETDNHQTPKIEVDDASMIISYKMDSLMKGYDNPVSNELNKLTSRPRVTQFEFFGSCEKYVKSYSDIFNSEKTDILNDLNKDYFSLDSCLNQENNPLKYDYISFLMNEIYNFIQFTLTGEKELSQKDYEIALKECNTIFQIQNGQSFINERPLYNVKLYIETLLNTQFILKNNTNNEYKDSILLPLKNAIISELEENKNATHLNYALAAIYSKENKLDSCILMLEETVNKSPKWLNAKFNLAQKYQEIGKIEESKKQLIDALSLDSTYKKFECFGCFFYVLEDIINGKENPYETEKEWNEILNLNLSKTEQFQVKFNLFLNASKYLGTFNEIIAYRDLKKSITNNFSDKMLMLVADIQKQKMFLRDKKIRELIELLDLYSKTNELGSYLNGSVTDKPIDLKTNKLFNHYFPQEEIINGYSKEDYLVYRKYIVDRLTKNCIIKRRINIL